MNKSKHGLPAGFRRIPAEALLLALCALCFLLALGLPLTLALSEEEAALTPEEAALLEAWHSGQLIRLHVLADDDSPQAQQVKLQVRDALLAAFSHLLQAEGERGPDALYGFLCRNVSAMERVAQACARTNGFYGSVAAQAGVLYLPEKRYGQVLLPPGDYRCLRVTLGRGQGRNWWCVLFPQLCLALAEDEPAPQETVEPPALGWHSQHILSLWPAVAPEEQEGR